MAATVSTRVLWSQIIALTGYSALCLFSLLLLAYLRINRHVAFTGDTHATRKVILPAFEPLLWILAAVPGSYALFFCLALKFKMYTTKFPSFDGEVIYAGRQFVFVLALVFLCQKSVSLPALRRAVAKSVLLASYTVPVVWVITRFITENTTLLFIVKLTMRPLLLIFVVYVCFVHQPAGRASPFALRIHGAYILAYHVAITVNIVLQQNAAASSLYAATSYLVLIWGSFCPLAIWSLLRADTEYWRGMGQRVWSLQRAERGYGPQVDEGISSSRIHDLIEVHRKFLIDFAHLEIKRKIGEGASASVFKGRLQQTKRVAVKVYTPIRFTEDVVIEFSYEAALCASLSHPNIVEFYGMCISPPTIGLVFELCQGSLEDVLYAQAKTCTRRRATRNLLGLGGDVANAEDTFDRQQTQLNVAYMLDCARAVAYMHSFSPPLLHRDIKPANFLVDKCNNVKLTDFGDSRRLPRDFPHIVANGNNTQQTSIDTLNSSEVSVTEVTASAPPQIKMTVTGTVSYMAPEMIGSRTGLATYAEAADVYSLAITFWDILYPDREKYPITTNNPLLIFESVLNGRRPPLDDVEHADSDENLLPKLRDIISRAWRSDPNERPSMAQIVQELEAIQEELLAMLAQDLSEDFGRLGSTSVSPCERCFTGEFMVERMEDLQATDSRGEGIRLGRALMDAGFLHHLRHSREFEATTAMYFFDDENINLCQPVAMLEESADTSPESDEESGSQQLSVQTKSKSSRRSRLFSHLTATFTANDRSVSDSDKTFGETGDCPCRLLGQRRNVTTNSAKAKATPKRKPRWQKSSSQSHRLQSNCSASSLNSSGGHSSFTSSWKQRSKVDEDNTLTRKLLDQEENTIVIDINDKLEPMPVLNPAA